MGGDPDCWLFTSLSLGQVSFPLATFTRMHEKDGQRRGRGKFAYGIFHYLQKYEIRAVLGAGAFPLYLVGTAVSVR